MILSLWLAPLAAWVALSPAQEGRAGPVAPADTVPPVIGRAAAESLRIPPLAFDPPVVQEISVDGVPSFYLHDPSLPLVRLYARVKGGFGHFPRRDFGAASALPLLLRSSGSAAFSPDSVDLLMESLALEATFGGDGTGVNSTLDVLSGRLDEAVDLWVDLLARPRFDSAAVEVWRGRELEGVLRRREDPGRLAVARFNRLMYGDHSIGWEMNEADLDPGRLNPDVLQGLHGRIFCREHLVMGASGDLSSEEAERQLGKLVAAVPLCGDTLQTPAPPHVLDAPGVYVIPRAVEQSVIVMAHTSEIRRDTTPEYFASRVANSILGAGGFSSRLLERVRTEEGLAYGASSFWTTPTRYTGIVGAMTRTRSNRTVETIETVRDVLVQARTVPPSAEEVGSAVDQLANGFVFNFEQPGQIVSRRMTYHVAGLPGDWLQRYLAGTLKVTVDDVGKVLREGLRPEDLVILVVGDPDAFDGNLERFGPVTLWPEEQADPPVSRPSEPRGSPRSRP
jgi:zinc protease